MPGGGDQQRGLELTYPRAVVKVGTNLLTAGAEGLNTGAIAGIVAQVAEQTKNTGLHGDVEGGGGFVGQQNVRIGYESHCDHGPLTHPTGKFMGIRAGPLLGVSDTHFHHHLNGSPLSLTLGDFLVYEDGFRHLVEDGEIGIEATHGVLEDHGDAFSA